MNLWLTVGGLKLPIRYWDIDGLLDALQANNYYVAVVYGPNFYRWYLRERGGEWTLQKTG